MVDILRFGVLECGLFGIDPCVLVIEVDIVIVLVMLLLVVLLLLLFGLDADLLILE